MILKYEYNHQTHDLLKTYFHNGILLYILPSSQKSFPLHNYIHSSISSTQNILPQELQNQNIYPNYFSNILLQNLDYFPIYVFHSLVIHLHLHSSTSFLLLKNLIHYFLQMNHVLHYSLTF